MVVADAAAVADGDDGEIGGAVDDGGGDRRWPPLLP